MSAEDRDDLDDFQDAEEGVAVEQPLADDLSAAVKSLKLYSEVAVEPEEADLDDLVEEEDIFTRLVFYNHKGDTLAGSFTADPSEVAIILGAWDVRDDTVAAGLYLEGEHYEVHRWYDNLVYGRKGIAGDGEGIGVCRVKGKDGSYNYGLVTYTYPILSARAISRLLHLCKKYLTVL